MFIAASTESVPLGLLRGGQAITKCKERFKQLLELLIKIASLQTSFITLDEVIKITSRRVNALEHVVIPRIQGYIDFIKKVLDEQAREDFFRLKKLTDKKKKLKEDMIRQEEKARELKHQTKEEEENMSNEAEEDIGSALESFGQDKGDEDLIF